MSYQEYRKIITKKSILFGVVIITLIVLAGSLVDATSIGEFQLGEDVEIYQTCNNCTYCNFTRVKGLNSPSILTNKIGVQDGTYYYYNVEAGNFTANGDYEYCYDCGNTIEKETGCINFKITYNGVEVTEEMTSIYSYAFLTLLFLLVLVILVSYKLPSKDSTDEEGVILQISNLKHLRPVCWGIAWSIILAIVFLVGNMTLAYLPSSMVGDLFMKLFLILFGLTLVALPLWVIWIFTGIFRDKEFKAMIERGVDVKSYNKF